VDNHQIDPYLPDIYKKLEWLDREELIKHFVSVEFNRFLAYYKNAPDLNVSAKESKKERDRKGTGNVKFQRFHINVGSKHSINASHLLGMINEVTDGNKIEIGKIDILRNFSFFDADSKFEGEILQAFQETYMGDYALSVTKSKGKKPENREETGSVTRTKIAISSAGKERNHKVGRIKTEVRSKIFLTSTFRVSALGIKNAPYC
jgi:ATP-dependent RNA helicase DeaD